MSNAELLAVIAAALAGYLAGSIPFGLLLTRLAGLAALTLLLDALKGALAAAVAGLWSIELAMAAGFFAFIGHLFPVWLNFKGGKGVATYIGVLVAFAWQAALAFAAFWLAVAFLSRYSSLAALVAAVATPLVLYALGMPDVAGLFAVMSALILYRHRENIQRLRLGTEGKIGAS